jgi:phenylalanyl-tRNA synthetase beta chain
MPTLRVDTQQFDQLLGQALTE